MLLLAATQPAKRNTKLGSKQIPRPIHAVGDVVALETNVAVSDWCRTSAASSFLRHVRSRLAVWGPLALQAKRYLPPNRCKWQQQLGHLRSPLKGQVNSMQRKWCLGCGGMKSWH